MYACNVVCLYMYVCSMYAKCVYICMYVCMQKYLYNVTYVHIYAPAEKPSMVVHNRLFNEA
jgi:hypothetical protein